MMFSREHVRSLLFQQYALNALAREDAYAAGYQAGRRDAEREMDEAWARLAATVRRTANRLAGPVPEPRPRPQYDDSIWFTADEQARLGIFRPARDLDRDQARE